MIRIVKTKTNDVYPVVDDAAKLFRKARKELGLRLGDVAEILDVSIVEVSGLEQGAYLFVSDDDAYIAIKMMHDKSEEFLNRDSADT